LKKEREIVRRVTMKLRQNRTKKYELIRT
jgi:hypothetical protein